MLTEFDREGYHNSDFFGDVKMILIISISETLVPIDGNKSEAISIEERRKIESIDGR
jgi:hypothetical protein